jgi:predicted aspartyl protease
VTLDRVEIGPLSFEHVPASVNEGDAPNSLLGMHLLQRLGSLEIRDDALTLRR